MNKERPKWEQISRLSEVHKYYWVLYDSLQIMQDILYHKWEDAQMKYQIVLPKSLKTVVLQKLHNGITGGHLVVKKTLSKIRDRYFWHHMSMMFKSSVSNVTYVSQENPLISYPKHHYKNT